MPDPLNPVDLTAYLAQPSPAEQMFRRLFRTGDQLVICDIGACEGEDTVRYARAFPRSRVLAFEPLPANQTVIRANLARYQTANAELVPVALSDRSGEAKFHVSSGRPHELFAGENWNYGNKSSSLLAPAQPGPMHGWIDFKESITVPTTTLDAFCAARGIKRVDFIQMDVQGAELLVLQGATTMLPRLSAIWLEVATREHYRGQPLDRDLARFMRGHGFILAYKSYLGPDTGEGDHLYLNLRRARTWSYLAAATFRRALGRVRRIMGGRSGSR
jgi:FkbM family methyltransferase